MARIRSVFPGQWTDEDFVQMSFAARLLVIGLRNEADDNGVFEWKPIMLKMQLFPADAVNIADLLAEAQAHNQIKVVDASGKQYGLIRNFRRWQRPEKPRGRHPLPDEHRAYVGLVDDKPNSEGGESPTGRGKSPQREEGGGMREEGISPPNPPVAGGECVGFLKNGGKQPKRRETYWQRRDRETLEELARRPPI